MSAPRTEWVLQRVLLNGFAYFRHHPDMVGFALRGYTPSIIEEVTQYLAEHPAFEVVVNHPRRDLSLPFIAIVTAGDNESPGQDAIGDTMGMEPIVGDFHDENGELQVQQRTGWEGDFGYASNVSYECAVTTNDANLTLYMTELVRFIIFSHKFEIMDRADLHNLTISIRDFQFNPQYFPEFWYARAISLSGLSYWRVFGAALAEIDGNRWATAVMPVIRFVNVKILDYTGDENIPEGMALEDVTRSDP